MSSKCWVLMQVELDYEGYERESFEGVYLNKPSKQQLEDKFKYYELRPNFIEDLLDKGEAKNGSYNWDFWHFKLREQNFSD